MSGTHVTGVGAVPAAPHARDVYNHLIYAKRQQRVGGDGRAEHCAKLVA